MIRPREDELKIS